MSAPPRVLFLLPNYPPAFGGGARSLQQIRAVLSEGGLESEVLAAYRGIAGDREIGVRRLPSPGGEKLPRLNAYCFALLTPFALLARARHYDLIHTMGNAHHVYAAILAGRLLGKPVIISSVQNRHDDPSGIRRERFGRLKSSLFSRADRFICCSGYQLTAYRDAGYPESKVRFIPNGIDPARHRPARDPAERIALRDRLHLPRDEFIVVSVGAIIERKGIDLLIEAWEAFRAGGGAGKLVLVGPDRADDPGGDVSDEFVRNLRERLRRSGAETSVIFTGQVGNVPDYLRSADAFALLSRGEGFPFALLEAMAAGLPFLIWDLPDYGGYDLADGTHGYLVPPFDVRRIAERLEELSARPELRERMGGQSRALASRFTLERSAAAHLSLYRELGTASRPGETSRMESAK
jgi:glycosyltransferase involved in cell wall biosynthesis